MAKLKKSKHLIWFLLALAVLGGIAYHNSLDGPFIFDDQRVVMNKSVNYVFTPVWKALFPERGTMLYNRPLLLFSLAVNYNLSGFDPKPYHLTNIAIHIFSGLFLFGILRRTLRLNFFEDLRPTHYEFFAFACAALWLVHPIQTQSVNYIVQRGESMMGMFYLGTFYTFLRSLNSKNKTLWRTLSVICCYLGGASKEVIISAPTMLLVFDRLFVSKIGNKFLEKELLFMCFFSAV